MNLIQLYKNSFSGLSRDIWKVALIYLVNRCGEGAILFMSVYLTTKLGFSKTESGIIMFCFGLGALIGSNLGGYLTDQIGNFKVMAISLFLASFAFWGIMLFTSFVPLCLWMAVTGICNSMFSAPAFSSVTAWGKPEFQTRGFSLLRMAINLGISIGPAMGGFLAYKFGYHWIFILQGTSSFLAFITLINILGHRNVRPELKEANSQNIDSPYKDRVLLGFLFFNLLNMVAFFQIVSLVPVYFKEAVHLNELLIGFFFTVNGLLVFFLEMPLVYIIEKKNKYIFPMILGALMIGFSYLSLSLFGPILAIVIYSLFVALGEVINFPLIPGLAMRRATEGNEGKYMGTVSMMFAMAFTLAPITGLPVVERIGYESYWYLAATMSLLSAIGIWMLRKHFVVEKL